MALSEAPNPSFPDLAPVRSRIAERRNPTDAIGILLGGGTIFSNVYDGVRTGGYRTRVRPALEGVFQAEKYHFLPIERAIYGGLSEDLTIQDLDHIEVTIADAISAEESCRKFLFFCGSDMAEELAHRLFRSSGDEFEENKITMYMVWSNEPVPHPEAYQHCHRALVATREQRRPGVYIISGNDVIDAVSAQKETWHGRPMRFYDTSDVVAAYQEEIRLGLLAGLANRVAKHYFKVDFSTLIRNITANVNVVQLDKLQTDPSFHPTDVSGQVLIKHLNRPGDTISESELDQCRSLVIVLNHSGTTRLDTARSLAMICQKRRDAGRPLPVFAVTETGEPRRWTAEGGLYPSGLILRDYVVLIPGHIKPTLVKLWAGIHALGLDAHKLISFMTINHIGELHGEADNVNIQRVLTTLRLT